VVVVEFVLGHVATSPPALTHVVYCGSAQTLAGTTTDVRSLRCPRQRKAGVVIVLISAYAASMPAAEIVAGDAPLLSVSVFAPVLF